MLDFLDMRTLSFATGLVVLFSCMPMMFFLSTGDAPRGMGRWTGGMIASVCGLALFGLRGAIPVFASIVLANLLLASFALLAAQGLAAFVGWRQTWVLDAGAFTALALALLIFTYRRPGMSPRVVALSLFNVLFTVKSIVLIWRGFPALSLRRNWLLLGTFALAALWYGARGALTGVFAARPSIDAWAGALQRASLALGIGAAICVVAGMLIANVQRMGRELAGARRELDALSGLLPVCSSCHKIRDEKGGWISLERYVSSHSEASFTHGLCDECAGRLYPDLMVPAMGGKTRRGRA
jgi:hypothetical protein